MQAVTHLAGATKAIDLHARSGGNREQKKKKAEERPSFPGRKALRPVDGSTTLITRRALFYPPAQGISITQAMMHQTRDVHFVVLLVSDTENARLHTNSHVV